jgi:uroporphyrin-3 C-methyltransferase
MERLKATPFIDTIAISAKLDSLMGNIDNLPLLSDPVSVRETQNAAFVAEPQGFWSKISREVLVDLGELVRIRNLEKPDVPLLSPSQAYFLRENFRLRLLNARQALLSRNEASFKSDIGAAARWLKEHFDTKIKAVTSAQTTLKQLAESPISISVPDITNSLDALRVIRQSNERGSR